MRTLDRRHWTDTLFVAYGILCALVLGLLVGQLVFGSVSFWSFLVFCLTSAIGFLAGAGFRGSLSIGTPYQLIAGSLLGVLLIAGCLWIVHWLMVIVVIMSVKVPGELWIAVSALTGFVGAIRPDAT